MTSGTVRIVKLTGKAAWIIVVLDSRKTFMIAFLPSWRRMSISIDCVGEAERGGEKGEY